MTSLEARVGQLEAVWNEHDARLSGIEFLTHNVIELTREVATLRQRLSLVEQFGTNQIDHANRIQSLEQVCSDQGDDIYDLKNKVYFDLDSGV